MEVRRRSAFSVLSVGLAVVVAGCGKESAAPPQSPVVASPASLGPFRLGMMSRRKGLDYFGQVRQGAEEASRELGVQLVFDGPADDQAEHQARLIDDWSKQRFDAIAVAPNDAFIIAPSMRKARGAGGKPFTLTWDGDVSPTGSLRSAFVNPAPAKAVAEALAEVLGEGMGGKGTLAIFIRSENAPDQNAWLKELKAILDRKYPKIRAMEPIETGEDRGRAVAAVTELLAADPDLKGICALTSVSLPAAAEAVKSTGKSGKVVVTGLGLPGSLKRFVVDGTVSKFVSWNPVDLGYLTVHVAKALAGGPLKPGKTRFGRLEAIEVLQDEVILGPPRVFDRSNVEKSDY